MPHDNREAAPVRVISRHDSANRKRESLLSQANPYLSIIIPAYNEETRLPPNLAKIVSYLDGQDYSAEIIVVENGSSDNTAAMVRDFAVQHPHVHLMEVDTRGKGLAVKAGMLQARGHWRFICDADLSMPIEEISKFLPPAIQEADIIIGTREGEGGTPHRRTGVIAILWAGC